MGLNNFPYTDLHSLNLDWILDKMKELISGFAEVKTDFNALDDDFIALQTYVNDYFNSLDLTDEVRSIINEMIQSGYFEQIVQEMVTEGYFRQIINDEIHDTTQRATQYNQKAADEFIDVCYTYYNNRSHLFYSNDGALNVTMDENVGTYGIDCSTFNLLALAGVPYDQSRYANGGTRDDNFSMYAWGIDMYSGRTKNVSGVAEYYRYAQDIARWFYDKSLVYVPNSTWTNVKKGDMMFWVDQDSIDNDDIDAIVPTVHHSAVFLGLDGSGNIQYIDANINRTYVVDTVTVSPQNLSAEVKFCGALPFLYTSETDQQIRAKAYLSANTSRTSPNYTEVSFTSIGGVNYSNTMSLTAGRLEILTSGLYLVSAQIKVTNSTEFIQWRTASWDSNNNINNISEGSVGAVTDINGNAHNGYANVSYIRYFNAGDTVSLTTAGTGVLMPTITGTYLEIVKI